MHLLEIFFTKLRFNLRSEVSRTYLGYAWWLLEPALLVAALYLVFGVFYGRDANNFVAFLVLGKVPFLWFSKSVLNGCNSMQSGRGLIGQVAISKVFFPMLVIFQDLVKQCCVFVLMFIFLTFYGLEPGWQWLYIVFIMVVQLTLITSLGLVVAAINAIIPDFRFLVATGMMMLMFGSGIFYNYQEVILPEHQGLFLLNPIALLLKNYRQVIMDLQAPDWLPLLAIMLVSAVVIAVMLDVYRRADNLFARLAAQ
jgi:lipopolysaccharide transport system permease protein